MYMYDMTGKEGSHQTLKAYMESNFVFLRDKVAGEKESEGNSRMVEGN